jgi:hypothetical protein
MPFTPFNTGSVANDGTGEGLRDAITKLNTMLLELFTAVDTAPTETDLDEAVANINSQLGTLAQEVASRASNVDLGGKADRTSVAVVDDAQNLSGPQKAQLARNTGQPVTLMFTLVEEDVNLALGLWKLPRFPVGFYIHNVDLTMQTNGGGTFTFQLKNSLGDILAHATTARLEPGAVGGRVPFVVASTDVPSLQQLSIHFTNRQLEYTDTASKGLTLWLRGHWQ